jgi:hypothetical protein
MLASKRISQYLLYAMGEIVLVVIGILIALQINNWNKYNQDLRKETQIEKSLLNEFTQNLKINNQILDELDKTRSACLELMEICVRGLDYARSKNVDSLIYWSIEHSKFIPLNNTFTEILNTGQIELVRNDTLKNALFAYQRELDNNESTHYIYEKWVEEGMLPYFSDHIALRNIDVYSSMKWKERSRFESGTLEVIDDRKFENFAG